MGIYQWLRVGIALFLAFTTPVVRIGPDRVTVTLEMENLLTDEMKQLLVHGVDFEFELYCSVRARSLGAGTADAVLVRRVTRRISFDYLKNAFLMYDDDALVGSYSSLGDLIRDAKRFRDIGFELKTTGYSAFSVFAQVRLLENQILAGELQRSTRELWLEYTPSVEYRVASGGAP